MLLALPLIAFVLFFLAIWTAPTVEKPSDWREAFLQAAVLWGVVLTAITEGLSLMHALNVIGVGVGWGTASVVALAFAARSGGLASRWQKLSAIRLNFDWAGAGVLAAVALIVVCLLVIAWVSPPNNTDSLQYHMSRVVHWAQDATLAHYPTVYEPQLWQPIWAETAILNLRLLWGSDTPAALVQWFSMLGSLVGVAAIAKRLGAGPRGQILAATFALSLPIGILEATSTQNDYVAAFWLVCLAFFVLEAAGQGPTWGTILGVGGALGLGLLTKGTMYPYALPFLVWFAIGIWKRRGWKPTFVAALVTAAIAVLLNLGFWLRNIGTYGGPLGQTQSVDFYTGISRPPAAMLVAFVSNLSLNLALPGGVVDQPVQTGVEALARVLHTSTEGFHLTALWNFEDLAGNPVHLLLVPLTLGVLWLRRQRVWGRQVGWYVLVTLLSFATMTVVVFLSPWGVRFQASFFVVWAPAFGVGVEALGRRLAVGIAGLLVMMSLPWVLFNRTRPMISWRPRTSTDSVFTASPSELLFANWIERRDPSVAAAAAVEATGCKQVGLRLDSHDWEYSFWWLLQAPQSGTRLEVLNAAPYLLRYAATDFRPCVVICTICGDRPVAYGLPLKAAYSDVRVYSGGDFVSDFGE